MRTEVVCRREQGRVLGGARTVGGELALAGGVDRPHLNQVGGAGGEAGDGFAGGRAGADRRDPIGRRRGLVAYLVARYGAAVVARRGPRDVQTGGACRGDGRRRRAARLPVGRAGAGAGVAARPVRVAGAHLHVVGNAGRQAGDGCRGRRAGERMVRPTRRAGPPVAHVVVGDGAAAGGGCRPSDREAGVAAGHAGRRGSGRRADRRAAPRWRVGALAALVLRPHLHMVGDAGGQAGDGGGGAGAGEGVRGPAGGGGALVAHVVVRDAAAAAGRRGPANGQAGGARGRRRRRGWSPRRAARRAGAGRGVGAFAGGVAGANPHAVGGARGQAGDGGGGASAGESVVGPAGGRGGLVAHVVAGDGAAGVGRRGPSDAQAGGTGG